MIEKLTEELKFLEFIKDLFSDEELELLLTCLERDPDDALLFLVQQHD